MKLEMTERDKKLLIILGVFLIVVLASYFIIYPLAKSCIEVKEQAVAAQEQQEENERKVQNIVLMKGELAEVQETMDEMSGQFYPMLASEDIDNLLTGIVLEKGLSARSMSILMPEDVADLSTYQYAKVQETDEVTNETQDAEIEDETPVGVYAANVTLTVAGDQNALEQLLDALANDYPAMRMTAMNWEDQTSINTITDASGRAQTDVAFGKGLTVSLEIYMYDETMQQAETQEN